MNLFLFLAGIGLAGGGRHSLAIDGNPRAGDGPSATERAGPRRSRAAIIHSPICRGRRMPLAPMSERPRHCTGSSLRQRTNRSGAPTVLC